LWPRPRRGRAVCRAGLHRAGRDPFSPLPPPCLPSPACSEPGAAWDSFANTCGAPGGGASGNGTTAGGNGTTTGGNGTTAGGNGTTSGGNGTTTGGNGTTTGGNGTTTGGNGTTSGGNGTTTGGNGTTGGNSTGCEWRWLSRGGEERRTLSERGLCN
jgi:hypothetical protein